MVVPLADGAVQVTSSAGFDCWLNVVRVSVGAAGLPASTSVTLMLTLMTAAWPSTV